MSTSSELQLDPIDLNLTIQELYNYYDEDGDTDFLDIIGHDNYIKLIDKSLIPEFIEANLVKCFNYKIKDFSLTILWNISRKIRTNARNLYEYIVNQKKDKRRITKLINKFEDRTYFLFRDLEDVIIYKNECHKELQLKHPAKAKACPRLLVLER